MGPSVTTPTVFNFASLLKKAVEREGPESNVEGHGVTQDVTEMNQTASCPGVAPVFQSTLRCKRGTRGRRIKKEDGGDDLEEAVPSAKAGRKRRNRAGKGHQAIHIRLQKLAKKKSAASEHHKAHASWVKHAVSTIPIETPLHASSLPANSTGYTACQFTTTGPEYDLCDLIGPEAKFRGFSLVEWDGR